MSLIALFWWIWSIYKDGDFPASPNNLFLRLPLVPLEAHLVVSHVPHQFQIQLRSSFPSFIQTVQNKEVHYFSQVALPTFSSSSVNLLCPHYFPWQPGRSHWTGGGLLSASSFLFWALFAVLAFRRNISAGAVRKVDANIWFIFFMSFFLLPPSHSQIFFSKIYRIRWKISKQSISIRDFW